MPPKSNKQAKEAQKAKEKQKAKVIEDKTFGLKNKNKSKKVQTFINNLQKSAQANTKQQRLDQTAQQTQKSKKQLDAERKKELDEMLAMSIKQPKLPVGVDPKSVVCELFKHKLCTKGYKCKYSHDLTVGMKSKKIDLYTDRRDAGDKEEEGMEDWDQETLEKVVKEKHGEEKGPKTEIVCKYFLDAVEKKQYGWFWKCPNGSACIYRHALPPGYVLKSQMSALLEEEKDKQADVAEEIEEERRKVEAKTQITEAVFREWHTNKMKEQREKKKQADEERRAKGILNGREIFMMEGFEAMDDMGAADEYAREDNEDEIIKKIEAETKQRWEEAQQQAVLEGRQVGEEIEDVGSSVPSSSNAVNGQHAQEASSSQAGPSRVELTPEEEEELFGGDDEDELDDDELDEIENQLIQQQIAETRQ
eukprot:TRINITY_DN2180_c0_g2_i7.p2 TRINITY_DN2180_c0_g2~~TRINITY_DN2180_c0_g2_i7.p2  ORF type:complete len:420 (-),score=111.08 TRINITY_DN2180_c0_g2_i7:340-1599(-)